MYCFISSDGFKVFIGADYIDDEFNYEDYKFPTNEISLSDLAQFPSFLRFNNVLLPFCGYGDSKSNAERRQLFDACLQSIREALIDSNKIFVCAQIFQENARHFSDHQAVIDYLSNRLLPICASSRSYRFCVWFDSDENSMGNFIDSILRMPLVSRCSNVTLKLLTSFFIPIQLPLETISNWLDRNTGAMQSYQKQQKDLFLHIFSHCPHQNVPEMWALLKMVTSFNSF